jgi:hypothetical protein
MIRQLTDSMTYRTFFTAKKQLELAEKEVKNLFGLKN